MDNWAKEPPVPDNNRFDKSTERLRIRCLELALAIPNKAPHHTDVVSAAKAFEKYILDKETTNG